MERKKKKIREDLGYLRTNKIPLLKSRVYTPKEYVAEEEKLEAQLSARKDSEDVSDVAVRETMKDIEKLSELYVAQDALQYKVKKGFEAFENRFVAVCDPLGWLSELSFVSHQIRLTISSLSVFEMQ